MLCRAEAQCCIACAAAASHLTCLALTRLDGGYIRRHAADLTEAGATTVIVNNTEAGTAMGSSLLSDLGVARESQLAYLTSALRKQMEARC